MLQPTAGGDPILGYITRGRGITIHREDCKNVDRLRDMERLIAVDWGDAERETYPVMIRVRAANRGGLLRDVTSIVADQGIDLTSANAVVDVKARQATITATLQISSVEELSRVLEMIERVPDVLEARRLVG